MVKLSNSLGGGTTLVNALLRDFRENKMHNLVAVVDGTVKTHKPAGKVVADL